MRQWKKSCYALLLGCMVILFGAQSVLASAAGNAGNYTYTVTVYAGKQGTISGSDGIWVDNSKTGSAYQISGSQNNGDMIVISGLQYGDVVGMDAHACTKLGDESKYYIRGIRESGHDNNTVSASAFTVQSDREYVVAYGIKGNMVSYVVKYVDTEGNELLKSQTYYGAVGDSPVVAFRYIENYWPQSYNLTKTLSANEAKNVFTFVYTSMYEKNPDEDEDANADEQQEINEDDNTNVEDDANAGDEEVENPDDLINLDDEDVPLAAKIFEQVKNFAKENTLEFIGLSVLILLGLSVLLLFLLKHKKKNKKEKTENETKTTE